MKEYIVQSRGNSI